MDAPRRCTFPPPGALRSYMMDVAEDDAVAVPDPLPRGFPRAPAAPLSVIPAEAWEFGDPSEPVGPGCVLPSFLTINIDALYPGGRTPCREEHVLVLWADAGLGRQGTVVLCTLLTWEDYARYRRDLSDVDHALREAQTGKRPGLLPVLLPRDGYDHEARVFVSTGRGLHAATYEHAAGRWGHGGEMLRLAEPCVTRLASTFGRGRRR